MFGKFECNALFDAFIKLNAMTTAPEQSTYLSTLASVPAERLKPFAELILADLGAVDVLQNRTGLVMLPYTDSVEGVQFHLGEVLISEAHVRLADELNQPQGYGACLGRDLEQSLAIAILDAVLQGDPEHQAITDFLAQAAQSQRDADEQLLRQVEATRVEMETF